MVKQDDLVMLPEHAANPFIEPLGPVRNYWTNLDLFDRRPAFSEIERTLPHHLRRYCILRLFEFNIALDRQAQLEHHPTNLDHGCLFSCYPKPLQDASRWFKLVGSRSS